MVGSWNISSSPNESKFLGGDNTLQIKKEESVKHIIEKTEGMHNIDANGQLAHNQATSWNVYWQENKYWSCEHVRCQVWVWPFQWKVLTLP